MCTITIVPHDEGFRLGCNRDERLARPAALAPRVHAAGALMAVSPTDMPAGGTWVGVNERGLVTAVLNRTAEGDRLAVASLRCSRGAVARHVLAADDLDRAIQCVMALPLRGFDPFTLVAAQRHQVAVVINDGYQFHVSVEPLEAPLCFTSSSLGDAQVMGPRLDLFERVIGRGPAPLLNQPAFHAHQWPDRTDLSVLMRRADAATVSRTWIDLNPERACVRYEPSRGTAVDVTLPLRGVPCMNSPASSFRRS